MNRLFISFFEFFRICKFFDYLIYRDAVRKADEAHAKTGNRYYVIPNTDGKLIVVDRKNFRILKNKHYFSHHVSVNELISGCFYMTPYRHGDGRLSNSSLSFKLRRYYHWRSSFRHSVQKSRKRG